MDSLNQSDIDNLKWWRKSKPEKQAHVRIVVHGNTCIWWDDESKAQQILGTNIFCCPTCGGKVSRKAESAVLARADQIEKNSPGYRAFFLWQRGQCFKSVKAAVKAYQVATGIDLLCE